MGHTRFPLLPLDLIGQERFECSRGGVSIRSLGFGQVVSGDQQVDDLMGHIDAEMLQALPFAPAALLSSLGIGKRSAATTIRAIGELRRRRLICH